MWESTLSGAIGRQPDQCAVSLRIPLKVRGRARRHLSATSIRTPGTCDRLRCNRVIIHLRNGRVAGPPIAT